MQKRSRACSTRERTGGNHERQYCVIEAYTAFFFPHGSGTSQDQQQDENKAVQKE
jgi:hypothetical protein